MLEGIRTNEIIAGAYTNRDGICPMLAAHRAGGRTNVIAFARAWDRFAFRDVRSTRARRATERELLVLKAHLEASLLAQDVADADLGAARNEHLELRARREREHPEASSPAPERALRPRWRTACGQAAPTAGASSPARPGGHGRRPCVEMTRTSAC